MKYLYCDGGSTNNQDPIKRHGYGSFYITGVPYPNHEEDWLCRVRIEFGNFTNNEAEYKILGEALKVYETLYGKEDVTVHTDSELMLSQLQGTYKTKDAKLKPLKEAILQSIEGMNVTLVKVPRETLVEILGH